MAYESLALISTALQKLDCGQLGVLRLVEEMDWTDRQTDRKTIDRQTDRQTNVLQTYYTYVRFGESVEILHPLDQPFSPNQGGHILQHLTFSQSKTNFIQVHEYNTCPHSI